jgi:hypothetical protein
MLNCGQNVAQCYSLFLVRHKVFWFQRSRPLVYDREENMTFLLCFSFLLFLEISVLINANEGNKFTILA